MWRVCWSCQTRSHGGLWLLCRAPVASSRGRGGSLRRQAMSDGSGDAGIGAGTNRGGDAARASRDSPSSPTVEQKAALATHLGMSPSALHTAPGEIAHALSMTGGFNLDAVATCSHPTCDQAVRELGDLCPKVCSTSMPVWTCVATNVWIHLITWCSLLLVLIWCLSMVVPSGSPLKFGSRSQQRLQTKLCVCLQPCVPIPVERAADAVCFVCGQYKLTEQGKAWLPLALTMWEIASSVVEAGEGLPTEVREPTDTACLPPPARPHTPGAHIPGHQRVVCSDGERGSPHLLGGPNSLAGHAVARPRSKRRDVRRNTRGAVSVPAGRQQ